ncbi:MAG: hypothetical protein LQ349_007862 [Xanthoria aureola]|nr:MAG: hypothetical protein LQ349_007862 [Xanthoria aureola]
MSERGNFRGGRGGGGRGGGVAGGGGDHRGGRGGAGGARGGPNQSQAEKPKKENILDLTKYMDKEITVKFNGGREVVGTLKGYDQLMNLVLDDVKETLRDDAGNETTRPLGLIVARGTLLVLISPLDGSEQIENPFTQAEE